MRSILHEPLVHFLVLGGLLFAAFAFINGASHRLPRDRIEVTEADAARLIRQFVAAAKRPPSQNELSNLIDHYIREEVLVREARALSFDRGDEIVRKRLVQKMQFLIESDAHAAAPTDADLRVHFERNAEKFSIAPVVAFKQLLLDPQTANAETALIAIRSGADPSAYGRASPLPADIPPLSKSVVDGTFGDGFFDQLNKLQIDQWSGPIRSAYGLHLVRVLLIEPGRRAPFDDVREKVEKDWRLAKAQERYGAILSRYEVKRPDVVPAR